MTPSLRPVNLRAPPPDFDEFVEWFEAVSYRLVLLEEYPLTEVRDVVRRAQSVLGAHMAEAIAEGPRPVGAREDELHRVLVSDHEWFKGSIEQLGWLLAIVEQEDQGGHRQALGQYGRILAEAVRRHRADERRFAARAQPIERA